MKKHYLSFTVVAFALVISVAYSQEVSAQEGNASIDMTAGTITVNGQTKVMTAEMRARYETKQKALDIMRKETIAEAQARKAAAEARGDNAAALLEAKRLKLEEQRAKMDAKREALRIEFEAKKASTTVIRSDFLEDIAKRKIENVTRLMNATVERLERIVARIESRIAKVKAEGGDTADSEKYIAEAKINISNAKTSIAAFASISLSGTNIRSNFEKIRAAMAVTKEHIRAAHQNLMLAVRSLGSIEAKVDLLITE